VPENSRKERRGKLVWKYGNNAVPIFSKQAMPPGKGKTAYF